MTALPDELYHYQILLDLSYPEIINWCLSHQEAARICSDYRFWKQKAWKDFQLNLDLIRGSSPSQKYKILSLIQESPKPIIRAIMYDQPDLFKALFNPDQHFDDLDEYGGKYLSDLIAKGSFEILRFLEQKLDPQQMRDLLASIYSDSIGLGNIVGFKYAAKALLTPYRDIFLDLIDDDSRPELFDAMVAQAEEEGANMGILNQLAFESLTNEYLSLGKILPKYAKHVDLERLIAKAKEENPNIFYLGKLY